MNRPKLLLADDSVTIRKVVELTFAEEGIDVTTVADAESAMQKFVELEPDIVLVDTGLSGTSGYQICEMIKADDATKHIPVLLLVGSFEPFDQDEAERCGADGFLTKPFHSIRDLVARVFDLLGHIEEHPTLTEVEDEIAAAAASADGEAIEHFQEDAFVVPPPETEDIENLYQRSLSANTVVETFEPVDELLGDAALDDEMIEASFPTEMHTPDHSGRIQQTEVVEDIQDFEWSRESKVFETMPAEPAVPEPNFVLDESDEVAVTSSLEEVSTVAPDDGPWGEVAAPTASEPVPAVEEAIETEAEPVAETAFEPEPESTSDGEASEPTEEPATESSGGYVPEADDMPGLTEELPVLAGTASPSPEFIDQIVQRVLEKLSDRVVREVAREEVPKIAEKLIREALDHSGSRH